MLSSLDLSTGRLDKQSFRHTRWFRWPAWLCIGLQNKLVSRISLKYLRKFPGWDRTKSRILHWIGFRTSCLQLGKASGIFCSLSPWTYFGDMLKCKCCSLFTKSIQRDIERRIFCPEGSKSNLEDTLRHMIPTVWFQPQGKQTVPECKSCCTYGSKYQHKVDQRDTFARTWMWNCQRKVQTDRTGRNFCSSPNPSNCWDIFRYIWKSSHLKKCLTRKKLCKPWELCCYQQTSRCNLLYTLVSCCQRKILQGIPWRICTSWNQRMSPVKLDNAAHTHCKFLQQTLVERSNSL